MLQSELEDLCFAVVSPHEYRGLRNELDGLWGLDSLPGIASAEAGVLEASRDDVICSSSSGSGLLSDGSHQKSNEGMRNTSEHKTTVAAGSNSENLRTSDRGSALASLAGSSKVSSDDACSQVKQSPSGAALKLAEKPAASSREATAVLNTRRRPAEADSRAVSTLAGASRAHARASKLAQLSSNDLPVLQSSVTRSSEIESLSISAHAELVQDPQDPSPSSVSMDQDGRVNSSASASSRGRGSALDASAASRMHRPKAHSRRQLTSRREHWAAKAAAAVVAEASRVTVSRDNARRNLRRPPSLKLTAVQLEVLSQCQGLAPSEQRCTVRTG